jgi:hypothetical protein
MSSSFSRRSYALQAPITSLEDGKTNAIRRPRLVGFEKFVWSGAATTDN